MSPKAGLEECGKFDPIRFSNPRPFRKRQVAFPISTPYGLQK